jgi:hypothetical protein
LKGVSTKYLQNYANWFRMKNKKVDAEEIGIMLMQNKDVANIHVNREALYKWFIENFSRRTYRCPVKRSYQSAVDQDALTKLSLL